MSFMNNIDTLSLILLNLNIDELKQLVLNKETEKILNRNDFWCQFLSKYNIITTKNCKYIALNYHYDKSSEQNFNDAVWYVKLPIVEYFLESKFVHAIDNKDKYEWFDKRYIFFQVLKKQNDNLLNLFLKYKLPTKYSIVFALAYKSYDMLEILLLHDINIVEQPLKTKILNLINCIHDYHFLDPIRIILEDMVDDLFEPYTNSPDSDFWEWRSDYLY